MNDQLLLKDCELGMKVYLTSPDSFYIINESNPAKSSKYSCTGIITELNSGIRVKWKNGVSNHYKDGELSLVERSKYHSIWPN